MESGIVSRTFGKPAFTGHGWVWAALLFFWLSSLVAVCSRRSSMALTGSPFPPLASLLSSPSHGRAAHLCAASNASVMSDLTWPGLGPARLVGWDARQGGEVSLCRISNLSFFLFFLFLLSFLDVGFVVLVSCRCRYYDRLVDRSIAVFCIYPPTRFK